jgi:hypothetical protein
VELIHIRVKYKTKDCRDGQRSLQQDTKARLADARDDDFLEMVAPQGDELVVDKTSAGTFNSTPLDQMLRNMGRDRLLVCGIVTEGCVELTARDAADRGFYVTLVPDACASSTRLARSSITTRSSADVGRRDGSAGAQGDRRRHEGAQRKVDDLCAMIAAAAPGWGGVDGSEPEVHPSPPWCSRSCS